MLNYCSKLIIILLLYRIAFQKLDVTIASVVPGAIISIAVITSIVIILWC